MRQKSARRTRRAQISGFMIMGIIIVLMIAAYFFINRLLVYDVKPYPVISPSFRPVQELVDTCMQQASTDAVKTLAAQGGYLKLPPRIAVNPDAHLDVVPGGLLQVPYWYYKGLDFMPSEQQMEQEIADYVVAHTVSCVGNFSVLSEQYNITSEYPTAKVAITPSAVNVQLSYPISATKYDTGEHTDLLDFSQQVDARLGTVYARWPKTSTCMRSRRRTWRT